MSIERRLAKLEAQAVHDAVMQQTQQVADELGLTVEQVLAEADRIVGIGIDAAEAELMRDHGLSREELDAVKAQSQREAEPLRVPSRT